MTIGVYFRVPEDEDQEERTIKETILLIIRYSIFITCFISVLLNVCLLDMIKDKDDVISECWGSEYEQEN